MVLSRIQFCRRNLFFTVPSNIFPVPFIDAAQSVDAHSFGLCLATNSLTVKEFISWRKFKKVLLHRIHEAKKFSSEVIL